MTDSASAQAQYNRRRVCVALVAFIIFTLVGLFISFELSDVYQRSRTDPDFQSFCAVSEGMNCETVALSEYATLFGAPVSVWASAGYIFAAVLAVTALIGLNAPFGQGFLFLLGIVFGGVSLWLVYLMHFVIGSLCVLCLALDAVNFGLLAMAVLAVKMRGVGFSEALLSDFKSVVRQPAWFAVVAIAGLGILAGAYSYGHKMAVAVNGAQGTEQNQETLGPAQKWTTALDDSGQCQEETHDAKEIQMGITPAGHPWVGGTRPVVEIQEFTDYECPYCRKAHLMVRRLLSKYPGKIKVYHRHYPLNNACNRAVPTEFHARACELSKVAVCAGKQGRFWEMNDFLFQYSKNIRSKNMSAQDIAKRLELDPDQFQCCMDDSTTMDVVLEDIEEGIGHQLKGTPAFIIDGTVYYGKIPDEAIEQLSAQSPASGSIP